MAQASEQSASGRPDELPIKARNSNGLGRVGTGELKMKCHICQAEAPIEIQHDNSIIQAVAFSTAMAKLGWIVDGETYAGACLFAQNNYARDYA